MSHKILVIDDETSILDSLAGILSDEGFNPICVDSAEKGLNHLKTDAVDLVLLDIWMPDMDGIEALTQIIILPGYEYRITNHLITNFHQPNSTLLLLIAAFIGDNWKKVYDFALANDFRFLSYGDSSILIP